MKTKNNKTMKEYEIVLSKMPETFTSHDYLKQLRRTSLPKSMIQKASHKNFLTKACEQLTKKTWRKTSLNAIDTNSVTVTVQATKAPKTPKVSVRATASETMETRINKAIDLLKNNGYKIYRMVEELV